MTESDIKYTLERLRALDAENEVVEFKEAKQDYGFLNTNTALLLNNMVTL